MATNVSAWSKPGAWALDSEEHEQELLQQHQEEEADKAANNNRFKSAAAAAAQDKPGLSDFPSLSVAATTKTKKKKGQTLSLSEFSSYGSAKPAYTAQPKGLTNEDLMKLPTGPRERTAEELDRSRIGGGFRSYGSNDRGDSSSSKWGSSRGSDEPRRQLGFGKDGDREFTPSRADEVDDWGAGKKSSSFGGGFERRDRGERGERGGFFDSQSRADESDSWVSKKSFVPSEGRRFGTGGGFERRGGGFPSNGTDGADADNWRKKKEEEGRSFGANGGGAFDSLRERRGGVESGTNGVDSDSWGKRREEVSVTGGGSGRPKLNLQPRRVPVGENPPADNNNNNNTVTVKPKGFNPFGDARPREEVLKEKGLDWKEVDEKLESSKIKEVNSPVGEDRFGKRSFGSGNGSGNLPEDRVERSWRKADSSSVDARPSSAEKTENGDGEEAEDNEPQM